MRDAITARGPAAGWRLAAAGWLLGCVASLPALAAAAPASTAPSAPTSAPAQAPAVTTPAAAAAGFDPAALDRGAAACGDFYTFACGGWIAGHPIPPDQAATDRFREAEERTAERLRLLLEDAAAGKPAPATAWQPPARALAGQTAPAAPPDTREPLWLAVRKNQAWVAEPQAPAPPPAPYRPMPQSERRKLGDDYASCMDEAGIEAKGLSPLQPSLQDLAALRSAADLPAVVARLHLAGVGALFRFASAPDPQHSDSTVAVLDQGGMALPQRDVYVGDDPASAAARGLYAGHVERMFALLGDPPARAAAEAADAVAVETALARGALDPVSRRDPERLDHLLSRPELEALTPAFNWNSYFGALGAPPMESLLVTEPAFLRAMAAAVAASGIDRLRSYLRWQVVHAAAPLLPRAFAAEDFAYFQQALLGVRQPAPRWRRCVAATGDDLDQDLGRAYVEQALTPAVKQRVLTMVDSLQLAFTTDISTRTWLTDPTKRRALVKLRAMRSEIADPGAWHADPALSIVRGDALGNRRRAAAAALARQVARIGNSPDRDEWQLAPWAADALYDPSRNDVTLPAGLLQPPFFDPQGDDAANYGALGSIIGSQLAHGFDDVGRRFDADGSLRDWWPPADLAEFDRRATCIADQYAAAAAPGDPQTDAHLTLGDDLDGAAGLRIAFLAYRSQSRGHPAAAVAGFDPEQRFFLAFAQTYCSASDPQQARWLAETGSHAPDRVRVLGALADSPEFAHAFSCPLGKPIVGRDPCRLW